MFYSNCTTSRSPLSLCFSKSYVPTISFIISSLTISFLQLSFLICTVFPSATNPPTFYVAKLHFLFRIFKYACLPVFHFAGTCLPPCVSGRIFYTVQPVFELTLITSQISCGKLSCGACFIMAFIQVVSIYLPFTTPTAAAV